MDLACVQPVAVLVDKERSFSSLAEAAVPAFRVIGQDLASRGMQRDQTGLPKLGSPNGENVIRPVHVSGLEVQRLTEPQARDRQYPNRQ